MTEKHENMNEADSIISNIEAQMALANLEKRGEYAACLARSGRWVTF
jgi:hypothetical protein